MRLDYVDHKWLLDLRNSYAEQRAKYSSRIASGEVRRTDYVFLATACEVLGRLAYAGNGALTEVQGLLAEGAEAHLGFLRNPPDRGADGRGLPGVDYSLTNSKTSLVYGYDAICAQRPELARDIASLMWDPVEAPYIGPRSQVCTPDEQRMARAVMHLLNKRDGEVAAELKRMKTPVKPLWPQAAMVRATVNRDPGMFVRALEELVGWWRPAARRDKKESGLFLCTPGLALSRLAIARGVVAPDALPRSEHLPRELLADQFVQVTLVRSDF